MSVQEPEDEVQPIFSLGGVIGAAETDEELEAAVQEEDRLQKEIEKQRAKITKGIKEEALSKVILEMGQGDLPEEIRERYEKIARERTEEKKIKETKPEKLPKTITRSEVINVSTDSEDLNRLLNSGIFNVHQSDPHWTSEDDCLVMLTYSAYEDWVDPRQDSSENVEQDEDETDE